MLDDIAAYLMVSPLAASLALIVVAVGLARSRLAPVRVRARIEGRRRR